MCQIQPGSAVCVNKVGTFGVASASYHWSRVASAIGRLAQCLVGHASHMWHMLVADDFLLEASGRFYRAVLVIFFLLCSSLNVPRSWNKTAGRDTVTWVGFELLLHSNQLGISERRAEWLTRWARVVTDSTKIQMNRFEEGLGRIVYVAGALEFEPPFLGLLYKFPTIHPRGSVCRVPSCVAERSRHYLCVRIGLI